MRNNIAAAVIAALLGGCAVSHIDTSCDNALLRADRTCDRDHGGSPAKATPERPRPEPPKAEPPKEDKEPIRELDPEGHKDWQRRHGIGG